MQPRTQLQYLAIEGVIGAGKTSLARMIASRFSGKLVLEPSDENPFLKDFYSNPEKTAFPTQLFFLLSRYRQQQEIPQGDLFHDLIVADYLFAKDRIFASINLQDREFAIYAKVASMLQQDIPRPDLVIYLQSNTERLMANIRKRNRSFERPITKDYLRILNEAYNQFFINYRETPLLIINSTEIDFVNNSGDFEELVRRISQPIAGTEFYSPIKI